MDRPPTHGPGQSPATPTPRTLPFASALGDTNGDFFFGQTIFQPKKLLSAETFFGRNIFWTNNLLVETIVVRNFLGVERICGPTIFRPDMFLAKQMFA